MARNVTVEGSVQPSTSVLLPGSLSLAAWVKP